MGFPRVHARFTVHSGHLCYGELHNIWQGALAEPSWGLTAVQPRVAGTVMTHKLDHNVSALNGTWNAFRLIDTTESRLAGWFVAHESVDVLQETDKILHVSGSPNEEDSGSQYNDEKTIKEGVLVINRYDWGLYDKRALDVVGEDEFDPYTFAPRIGAGLVDYAEAKAEVMFWKNVPEDDRAEEQRPHGLWLDIPQNEYSFGRFGFDDKQGAARSFLFFGIQTVFTQTFIAGMQQPLRKYETHEERFQRRLQEGFDFRGMETLKLMAVPSWLGSSPADGDLLGPHTNDERLFQEADFAALLRRNAENLDFVDPWRDRVEFLLNELLISYLERYILPLDRSFATILSTAQALTRQRAPQQNKSRTLDFYLFQYLTQPHEDPIPNWDAAAVAARVREFLFSRSGEQLGLFSNDEYIAGLCRCLAWLIREVLELASNAAKDIYRSNIMPADVRIAVCNDAQLFSIFKYSRVYWDGSE
ncbi:MAG: hypothetical protein L6R42_007823 [Xanthoria sp. 1 TBL-2021]|nr:MAG: hypothetical protein L6R42_007823 [Xanthoria sp. 1 TBL-2021]